MKMHIYIILAIYEKYPIGQTAYTTFKESVYCVRLKLNESVIMLSLHRDHTFQFLSSGNRLPQLQSSVFSYFQTRIKHRSAYSFRHTRINYRAVTIMVALLMTSFLGLQAYSETFGVNFVGNTGDSVVGTAGVVAVTNWNNISAATFTTGTIQSSDGSVTATLSVTGAAAAGSWHSGVTSDGGNGSLMDGYIDGGANHGGGVPITNIVSGLQGSHYSVYLYTYGDSAHPQNSGEYLPSYSVNGVSYFAPSLGNATTTFDSTATSVGGPFTGFIRTVAYATDFNTATANASYFGNYIEIDNVAPLGGVITIVSEADSRSWRSPLNGFEIAAAQNIPVAGIPSITPSSNEIYAGTQVSFDRNDSDGVWWCCGLKMCFV
jgi:hypothetical protein